MTPCLRQFRVLCLGILALGIAPAALRAQLDAAPSSSPAPADIELREWMIFVSDQAISRANPPAQVRTSLPDYVNSLRDKVALSERNQPSPIGVIRVIGSTEKISVKIAAQSAVFRGFWPPAESRSGELLWRDLLISDRSQQTAALDPGHWLAPLRAPSYPYLTSRGQAERFLLYEPEFPYSLPLRITGGKQSDEPVQIANASSLPLHDLTLYRPGASGWQTGSIAQVAPTLVPVVSTNTFTTGPAPVEINLQSVTVNQPADLFADWKNRLSDLRLDPADLDLIVRTLAANAPDSRQMTAVYRLDPAELDRLLPLQVEPPPRRIQRVALVIARNVDPQLPQIVDKLIIQLGDVDWHQREAATRALAEIGAAAEPKLRLALSMRDPEIVIRAERLLAPTKPVTSPQQMQGGYEGVIQIRL